jgi:hypothetical protein
MFPFWERTLNWLRIGCMCGEIVIILVCSKCCKCTINFRLLLIIRPTRCTNFSNLFWKGTLHVLDSSSVHHQEFFRMQAGSGCSILILLASCQQTFMTYTIAVCAVKNSWWWTEELSETCRVFFQNKFEKLVCLVGFNYKKFVMMHCHMNVKFWLLVWNVILVLSTIKPP